MLIFPTVALATTMCVRDDTLAISMYGGMKRGPGHEAPNEGVMWFDTDVGQLYFETTCLSESEGLGRTSGEGEFYGTGDYANTTITADKMQTGTDIEIESFINDCINEYRVAVAVPFYVCVQSFGYKAERNQRSAIL